MGSRRWAIEGRRLGGGLDGRKGDWSIRKVEAILHKKQRLVVLQALLLKRVELQANMRIASPNDPSLLLNFQILPMPLHLGQNLSLIDSILIFHGEVEQGVE